MGQLNWGKIVIVRNSRFYHNNFVFQFFRAIFFGRSSLCNGGLPKPKFGCSLTPSEDEIDVICCNLQIYSKLRFFPCSHSGAEKVQFRKVYVSSETLSIKYDLKGTMNINGR